MKEDLKEYVNEVEGAGNSNSKKAISSTFLVPSCFRAKKVAKSYSIIG